jgi:hypothetical protein
MSTSLYLLSRTSSNTITPEATMNENLVPVLADALRAYYEREELNEICGLFDEKLDWDYTRSQPNYLAFAKRLLIQIEHGNNRRILETLLSSIFIRCSEAIAKTDWERREYHQQMDARIQVLRPLLDGDQTPKDIAVPDNNPFTAKSEIRDLVSKAEGELLLVDAYVGLATLDCLRLVQHPIRILPGQQKQSVEPGFENGVKDFKAEGRRIEVRRHQKLHDRYLVFNERCWLIGSSIKDAGKKALNVIECVDTKQLIVDDAEKKWKEATPYL